jgi:hypothetical protein
MDYEKQADDLPFIKLNKEIKMNSFCGSCGSPMVAGAKFCGECGDGTVEATGVSASKPIPSSAGAVAHTGAIALPTPPSLHWAIVLILTIATVGIFAWIWAFVQAIWVKRLTGTWKPLLWLSVSLGLVVVASIRNPDASVPASLGWLFVLGVFSVRYHIIRHYNSIEPIHLKIGFWQTFFGSIFYLQHHFREIARLKREQPQFFAPYATPVVLSDEKNDGRFYLRFAAMFAVVAALVFVLIYFDGARNGEAADRQSAPQSTQMAAALKSGDQQSVTAVSGVPVQGRTPDVQVYVAPDTESVVQSTGLNKAAIKEAVEKGLAAHRIGSIADNAVIEREADWVSVRFSTGVAAILPDTPLSIEISVRNGTSANNQLIRWQETNAIKTTNRPDETLAAIDSLLNNLGADFNSPEYKTGRMNDSSK